VVRFLATDAGSCRQSYANATCSFDF